MTLTGFDVSQTVIMMLGFISANFPGVLPPNTGCELTEHRELCAYLSRYNQTIQPNALLVWDEGC